MNVRVPPPRTRLWFWATGTRLDAEYRPWVAQQIVDPAYLRRRRWPSLAFQSVLIVVPQTLLALASGSRYRLLAPAAVCVVFLAVAFRRTPMSDVARHRMLAYHGVTADGTVREPVSFWAGNPLGKTGLVLLTLQVLIFSSGIAYAADQIIGRRACHVLPAGHAAALAAVVGQPAPSAAFGPEPAVAAGAPLIAAREVDSVLPGVSYAAAYARDPAGRLLGPAVWRIIGPNALGSSPTVDVSAQNAQARRITPSSNHGSSTPEDPAVGTARACARAAR